MLPRDGDVRAKCATLFCGVVACESLHAIGVILSLDFTINLLNENLRIGVIVLAAFVVFERETKDCLSESCAALSSDLVGLVHGSGDACVSEKKSVESLKSQWYHGNIQNTCKVSLTSRIMGIILQCHGRADMSGAWHLVFCCVAGTHLGSRRVP